MRKLTLLAIVSLFGIIGCPQADVEDDTDVSGITVVASAPASVETGDLVSMTAQVVNGPGTASYRWFQTYGRVVQLSATDRAIVTFEAPSLPTTQEIRFRVDTTISGVTLSDSVSVVVAPDPIYGYVPDDDDDPKGDDTDPAPVVRFVTNKGTMVVQLDRTRAPISVRNFLRYLDDGHYTNTLFHRVIEDFVIQGGGFDLEFNQKDTREPIINESTNGLKNVRGSIAMARLNAPDSATSQFYFNLIDNTSLDRTDSNPGYAVFGRITEGLSVMDAIGAVETGSRDGMGDVPVDDVILLRVERVAR